MDEGGQDMTDAPEKIFATGSSTTGSWNHVPLSARISPAQIEYTRTDIAEARIAELEAVLQFMPEVLASLKQTGQDIGLAHDLGKALAALKGA
jgi:hypothetical protein